MGDEWQMIWVVKGSLETTGQWDSGIKLFHWQGYQFGALLIYLLTNFFGYDGKAVYIFSFITRFIATLALFYFLQKRGSSYKAAFLGSIFFILTPIGLQTTDWVKNFTSYISIAFFIICLNLIYDLKSWRVIIVFLITFSISVYVNAIRAPGIILTILFLLIIQFFLNKSKIKSKIIFSFFGIILIYFFFSKLLIFANMEKIQDYYIQQSNSILNQTISGNLDRIGDLFILTGRGLLPEPSLTYISLLVIILLLWKKHLLNKKYLIFIIIIHVLFTIGFLFIFRSSKEETTALLGMYFTLFMVSTFTIELLTKKVSEAMKTILPFLLNIFFVLTPWIFGNTDITESTHRYLIYPALSMPIIIGFSLNQNKFEGFKKVLIAPFKLNSIMFYTTIVFLFIFFFSIKSEINNLYTRHNQETARVIWQQITPFFNSYDFKNHRPIILFESDNVAMLHDTVLFGLDYRLGIKYEVWEENKLPIPLDGLQTLKSMLTDGKASKRYTGKEIVFSKEDAFYFMINGNKVSRIDISNLFTNNQ